MKYMIFDDSKSDQFLPMTYLRSTGDLRAGILKLRQRIEFIMEMEESAVIVAPELISLYRERHPDWQINQVENDEYLFINSRARLTLDNKKLLDEMPDGSILKNADNILAIRLNCKAQPIDYHSLIKMSQDLCVI
ncbi:MAG TPA: putative sugar nucleotidyl transferase, partial [Candidatus Cloacimonadota bacterium]|nr:putative sugar nucleotidyl transferase [Candidatus Cloacimonadota bacterium]